MKKRFIILVDFSEYSRNLISYAYDWCQQVGAELLLVHQTTVVVPSLSDANQRQQLIQNMNNEKLQELKVLATELISPTTKVILSVSETPLNIALSAFIAEPYQNIIFSGIKSTSRLKKLFLGSTTIEIIDNTNNIVVAIPKKIAAFSHEKIFIAVTKKYPLNLLELNKLLSLIDRENTSITFFYLAKPNEQTQSIENKLSKLTEMFADRYHTTSAIYQGKNPFDEIKKVINNKIDEILVVQKGSRLLTDQLFRKFLIDELVYEGETPLIVLP